ncbi:hypothetical protein TSOC_012977, partial [Tetrabaena socialis]
LRGGGAGGGGGGGGAGGGPLAVRELTNAMWALGAVRHTRHPVFWELIDALTPHLQAPAPAGPGGGGGGRAGGGGGGAVNAQDLANAVWALARGGVEPESGVLRLAEGAVLRVLPELRAQHVASLLWSFSVLRYQQQPLQLQVPPEEGGQLPHAPPHHQQQRQQQQQQPWQQQQQQQQSRQQQPGSGGAGGGGGRAGWDPRGPRGLYQLLALRAAQLHVVRDEDEGIVAQVVWALVREKVASPQLMAAAAQRLAAGAERLSLREAAMVASAYRDVAQCAPIRLGLPADAGRRAAPSPRLVQRQLNPSMAGTAKDLKRRFDGVSEATTGAVGDNRALKKARAEQRPQEVVNGFRPSAPPKPRAAYYAPVGAAHPAHTSNVAPSSWPSFTVPRTSTLEQPLPRNMPGATSSSSWAHHPGYAPYGAPAMPHPPYAPSPYYSEYAPGPAYYEPYHHVHGSYGQPAMAFQPGCAPQPYATNQGAEQRYMQASSAPGAAYYEQCCGCPDCTYGAWYDATYPAYWPGYPPMMPQYVGNAAHGPYSSAHMQAQTTPPAESRASSNGAPTQVRTNPPFVSAKPPPVQSTVAHSMVTAYDDYDGILPGLATLTYALEAEEGQDDECWHAGWEESQPVPASFPPTEPASQDDDCAAVDAWLDSVLSS